VIANTLVARVSATITGDGLMSGEKGTGRIRLALADDHAIVRAGLAELLGRAEDVEIVGSVPDGARAVALFEDTDTPPDVVLMDLQMPGMDGVEATRRILARAPEARIVILTTFADRRRIFAALDAGAIGYLLKDADPGELLSAVRAAAGGEAPLAPRVASEVLRDRRAGRPGAALSAREREVLRLVGEGLPNKLIGRRLGISERTVKAHLTRVFERIGVTDRTQAALWAQRNGVDG
jgi:DNA-binding NarL/FixJ family response regulator